MDVPISFSQYFINKQNVRSFRNIFKSNKQKIEDKTVFIQQIIKDRCLVSELSEDFILILTELKNNLKHNSKQDFRNYFSDITSHKEGNLISVNKEDVFMCCDTALLEVVPKSFFGGYHNIRIFRRLIKIIVYSMKYQHIMLNKIIEKWDFSTNTWKTLSNIESKQYLYDILVWIFKYILSGMICLNFYVTTCKLDQDEFKLHYFWKHQWQSFYDKKISNLIFTKTIKKCEPYCLGKKIKRNHSISGRIKLRMLKKEIPKLYLVLKTGHDFRPIVCYKNDPQDTIEKYRIRERLKFLKMLTGPPLRKIEKQFNSLHQNWVNLRKPRLYFVKTDLSNAFGSIDKGKLLKILFERHMNSLKREKNIQLKKKYAQQYSTMIAELRKPLLVRAGSTVYAWNEGLVQGYKYSPALSELYYTHMDNIIFSDFIKSSESLQEESKLKLFIRVVDDYLYVTDSIDDAHLFLKALTSYRNVNYEKTIVNFAHPTIRFSNEVTFLGYRYDTTTMQVCRANNVYTGQMCYKIAFSSSISNIYKFLENRIGQSGIQINGHIFNLYYNKEEVIWKHIFTTFCLSANKFCTILSILCEENDMRQYLSVYKKRVTVKLCNAIIETLIKNKPIDMNFMYCINHFRYLSLNALCLCAKQTPKCNRLVPFINDELGKSNCIFGKWKEHASRIDTSGKCLHQAVREICRRTDLRIIMRKFDTLPTGFQCYNQRILNKNIIK